MRWSAKIVRYIFPPSGNWWNCRTNICAVANKTGHSINLKYKSRLPSCQSIAELKYTPIEHASTTVMSSRWIPIHKSAIAKLHIRNLETVKRKCDVTMTITTNKFPITADSEMNQTGMRRTQLPIKSSQGLKASGSGWHLTWKNSMLYLLSIFYVVYR